MKTFIRILFGILNGIVYFVFVIPYFLTVDEKDDSFSSHFWAQPFTWAILAFFLFTFPLKFKAVKKIRKKNLHFKSELGAQSFWLLVRVSITGLWISWIVNDAVFNKNITEGLAVIGTLIGFILIMYWMYYGKKMRKEDESRLDQTLAKVLEVCPAVSSNEVPQLNALLTKSKLYDKKYDSSSQVLVGAPARSFVVRNRTRKFEHVDKHAVTMEDAPALRSYNVKDWKFYFCALVPSLGTKTPGLYAKSDFLAFFDDATAKKYNAALKQFKITSIEITNTGYVMDIEPNYSVATMGIKVPSQKDLNQLFLAFAK